MAGFSEQNVISTSMRWMQSNVFELPWFAWKATHWPGTTGKMAADLSVVGMSLKSCC